MYEVSRDYLVRLVKESGLNVGTAKCAAMVAIIELIDENSLGGLISAIKDDYKRMQNELEERNNLWLAIMEGRRQCEQEELRLKRLREEKAGLEERIKALEDEEKDKELAAMLVECEAGERSRVAAYKAALRLGLEALPKQCNDAVIAQVYRSASNVASIMFCSDKEATP